MRLCGSPFLAKLHVWAIPTYNLKMMLIHARHDIDQRVIRRPASANTLA